MHGAQHGEVGKKWVRAVGGKTGSGALRQTLWPKFAANLAHADEDFNRKSQLS